MASESRPMDEGDKRLELPFIDLDAEMKKGHGIPVFQNKENRPLKCPRI